MNKRIRKKKLRKQQEVIFGRKRYVIRVSREDWEFLQNLMKEPARDLPWIREVPKKLFLDF